MKTNLVRIGNSKGVRIPKKIIEECGLGDEVDLRVRGKAVIITPARKLREGWAESCKAMHAAGDDKPVWPDYMSAEADEDWTW